jgi:hypothetical protein
MLRLPLRTLHDDRARHVDGHLDLAGLVAGLDRYDDLNPSGVRRRSG